MPGAAASATYSGPATGVTSGAGSHAKNSRMLNRATSASTRQPVHSTNDIRRVIIKNKKEDQSGSSDRKRKELSGDYGEHKATRLTTGGGKQGSVSSSHVYNIDHAKKLQNIFNGSSKNEQAVEGAKGATQRTAGTTDTTQKTCESANNSNSMKVSPGHINTALPSKTMSQKPPRDSSTHH